MVVVVVCRWDDINFILAVHPACVYCHLHVHVRVQSISHVWRHEWRADQGFALHSTMLYVNVTVQCTAATPRKQRGALELASQPRWKASAASRPSHLAVPVPCPVARHMRGLQ